MGGVRFLISALISKQISDFRTQISADFNRFHHSVYEIFTVASTSAKGTMASAFYIALSASAAFPFLSFPRSVQLFYSTTAF